MCKNFLSWLGFIALLGLCGIAVGGLVLVKDRVRVVVQDDGAADPGAQQTAQLRDELQQVQRDVRALAEALGKGLQQLADDAATDAAARQAQLTSRIDEVRTAAAAMATDLAATRREQRDMLRTIADLELSLHDVTEHLRLAQPLPADTARHAQPQDPAAPPADAPEPAATSAVAPVATAPPAARPDTPAVAPRKRSTFAFVLPSQTFTFDLAQRFELLPSLSRVGFDAKSTLHDFSGVTSKLTGTLELNLAAPAAGCSGEVRVDARALDTGLAGRNDAMREHLATEQHPEIVFAFTSMTADAVDPTKQTVSGVARGSLTIRGRTRVVAMPVELRVDDSKRVQAKGEMTLLLTDYGVPVPSQLGVISMQDEVKVWIALQARALGAEHAR